MDLEDLKKQLREEYAHMCENHIGFMCFLIETRKKYEHDKRIKVHATLEAVSDTLNAMGRIKRECNQIIDRKTELLYDSVKEWGEPQNN